MNREDIKELALANGFELKHMANGSVDLEPNVYEFAEALLKYPSEERDFELTVVSNMTLGQAMDAYLSGENFFKGNCPIRISHAEVDGTKLDVEDGVLEMDFFTFKHMLERGEICTVKKLDFIDYLVDKVVAVRDGENDKWCYDMFISFDNSESHPYECQRSNWRYMRPLEKDEVYYEA